MTSSSACSFCKVDYFLRVSCLVISIIWSENLSSTTESLILLFVAVSYRMASVTFLSGVVTVCSIAEFGADIFYAVSPSFWASHSSFNSEGISCKANCVFT